jgi:hypothetical protein
MTAGLQCDTCRKFGPQQAGWLYLVQHPPAEQSPLMALVYGSQSVSSEPLTFCSVRCVAECAVARVLVEGPAAGQEPL